MLEAKFMKRLEREKGTPTFLLELWDKRNWNPGRRVKGTLGKTTEMNLWQGRIYHVQSGKRREFKHISEMNAFIEQNRA